MTEPTSPPVTAPSPSSPHAPRGHSATSIFMGPYGLRPGWGLLLFLLLFLAFAQIFHALLLAFAPQSWRGGHAGAAQLPLPTALSVGLSFLATLLATSILSRVEHRPLSTYGLGRTPRAALQFLTGSLFGLLFLSVLAAILWTTGLLVFEGRLLFGTDVLRYGLIWAAVFTLIGLSEEYLLRGYLLYTLTRALDGLLASLFRGVGATLNLRAIAFWISAFTLSFVFGLGHHGNPGESPVGLLTAGLAGLLFCLALWRSGSLWWAVGFHTAWDWAQSFLYGVPDSGITMRFHFLGSHPVGHPLQSGGLTGPEGSIYVLPVLCAAGLAAFFSIPAARRRPDLGATPPPKRAAEPSSFVDVDDQS